MLSILDGTWASGAPPQEYIDYQLMKTMRWSWEQLRCTPLYVKTYSWDFILAERRARISQAKDADHSAQAQTGVRRVRR